jgi:5-formyltetrahydrofolate cyclo-ligase
MASRRDAMTPAERATASAEICRRAVELALPHQRIALYASKGSEVDTAGIDEALRARGAIVVYPRVLDDRLELLFRAVQRTELERGRFGLLEPALGEALDPATIDLILVPGLAFDRDGWRIGWGRGYYDATLKLATQAVSVGLAFECQLVDEVPHEPHDTRLTHVLTEMNLY